MRNSVKTLTVALAAIGFASGAVAADAKYNLKMTTTTPEGTVTWKMFAVDLENKVSIATDGAVKIKAYGSGAIAGLFELVAARGLAIADLRTHRPTLEDVFVSLTGKHLRDE